MTPEQMENAMSFIVEQQAKFSVDMELLKEAHEQRMKDIEAVQTVHQELMEQLTEASVKAFNAIAELQPRFGTPARAILVEAAMASLLAALGTFNQIVAYFVFVTVIFIALTVGSVFTVRGQSGDSASRHVPGYPVTPIVFLAFVGLLLFLLASNNPRQALLGVAIVLLGAPVYYLIFHRRERKNTDGLD